MSQLEVRVQDAPAVSRMVLKGVGVLGSHKEVEPGWSEEGCDLLAVTFLSRHHQDLELLVSR